MKDVKGNELQIGDKVVFVKGKNTDASIDVGFVKKFYKGSFGHDECSVDSQSHVRSNRILKLTNALME